METVTMLSASAAPKKLGTLSLVMRSAIVSP